MLNQNLGWIRDLASIGGRAPQVLPMCRHHGGGGQPRRSLVRRAGGVGREVGVHGATLGSTTTAPRTRRPPGPAQAALSSVASPWVRKSKHPVVFTSETPLSGGRWGGGSPALRSLCRGPGTVPRVASVNCHVPRELQFLFIDVETKAQSGYERRPQSHRCSEVMEQ